MTKLRIGLDLDDTVNYWFSEYLKVFGIPKNELEITKNVRKLRTNKQFWENLPILHRPDFIPTLYCTKRTSSKKYIVNFLNKNSLPKAPIYQMFYQNGNKASVIKGKVDVFIDDSLFNFITMNLSGVPCLLMDGPHNRSWSGPGRVYDLSYNHILDVFKPFKEEVFPNFKKIVNAYKQ